jgi:hypothetical protein
MDDAFVKGDKYMIILLNNEGQMCNRIKEFAHCIATGIENKENVVNLTWADCPKTVSHMKPC